MQTLTITNSNIFLEAAWTPKPLNSLDVGVPLTLKFANHLSKAFWDWQVTLRALGLES